MNDVLKFVLAICMIVAIIASFILRIIRHRQASAVCELLACGLFTAFSSQYAYLFVYITSINLNMACGLLLFIFSVILLIYKVITFIKYR